ncbi:MAG: UDP-N-acetylmuramoyl-L-alanyl-D-glutamate--2,6-diaminopimelate ligase, partial [Mycobacterium sp.]
MSLRPSNPAGLPLAAVADLLAGISFEPATGLTAPDIRVTGVTLRCQDAEAGDLFAALPGSSAHGA